MKRQTLHNFCDTCICITAVIQLTFTLNLSMVYEKTKCKWKPTTFSSRINRMCFFLICTLYVGNGIFMLDFVFAVIDSCHRVCLFCDDLVFLLSFMLTCLCAISTWCTMPLHYDQYHYASLNISWLLTRSTISDISVYIVIFHLWSYEKNVINLSKSTILSVMYYICSNLYNIWNC